MAAIGLYRFSIGRSAGQAYRAAGIFYAALTEGKRLRYRTNRKGHISDMAQRQSSWTKLFDGYKGDEEMPLAGYAGLLGIFGVYEFRR